MLAIAAETGIMSGATPERLVVALILILFAGLVGGLVAQKLHQPLILGYILVGALVGIPYKIFSDASSDVALQATANIGVALLLFSMGLEFSKKDIKPIYKVAVWGALIQVLLTLGIAFGIGKMLKLNTISALLFGVAFVSTSTAVILKVLVSRNRMGTLSSQVMIGMSIVQDLTVIPLMILICNMNKLSDGWFLFAKPLVLGTVFMVVMMMFGTKFVPWLLKFVARWNSKELFLLAVTAISLGIGYISDRMELSFSFGAFLAGIVLSDSDYGKKALYEMMPVRDLFSMLFFVSVGMLLDWQVLRDNFTLIMGLMLLTSLARTIPLAAITAFYGYRNVIPVAMLFGMTATSEIAFVVIEHGLSNAFFSKEIYALILCVVVCSMLSAPLLDNLINPVYKLLRKTVWKSPISTITIPESGLRDHVIITGSGAMARSIATLLKRLQLPYLIIDSDHLSFQHNQKESLVSIYGDPHQEVILNSAGIGRAKILLAVAAGFSENLTVIRSARELHPDLPIVTRADSDDEVKMLHGYKIYEVVQPKLEASLEIIRQALLKMEVPAAEIQNYSDKVRLDHYRPLLEARSDYQLLSRMRSFVGLAELHWVLIPNDSPLKELTLKESRIRSETGVSIVGVMRDGCFISNPGPEFKLAAGDMLAAIGTLEQNQVFENMAITTPIEEKSENIDSIPLKA